ncbi:MAG: DUF5615 family PIN-like protein [Ignavibacteria bacterium]|nr:DUF5615 family PIN-like protein [Ignavibacteria bacterium]
MSLLFDNNLSVKLVQLLHDHFPGSVHVIDVGLRDKDDIEIWKYAKKENLTIVTKDKDFYYLNSIYGSPPKLIWLVIGNCKIVDTVTVLKQNKKEIIDFINSDKDLLILEKIT